MKNNQVTLEDILHEVVLEERFAALLRAIESVEGPYYSTEEEYGGDDYTGDTDFFLAA